DSTLQRRELIRTLRESEAWLSATLRCAGDAIIGIIATDGDNRVRALNAEAERLTGSSRDVIGELLAQVAPTAGAGLPGPTRRGARRRELLVPARRSATPVESIRAPIVDDRGQRYGTVWVLRDISEQVRRERGDRLIAHMSRLLQASRELLEQRGEEAIA